VGAGCLCENNCSTPLCASRAGDARWVSETRALYRAGTHVHIVEFIFIAEITAAIHSRPVIYSEKKSLAPHLARTRGEKGSGGAEIESLSTSKKSNIVSDKTDCWPD